MSKTWKRPMKVSFLIVLLFLRASAQDRYIVRAPASAINGIAGRSGLTLLNVVGGVVSGLGGIVSGIGGLLGPLGGIVSALGGTISSLGAPNQDVYLVTLVTGPAGAQTLQKLKSDPAVQAIEPDQATALPEFLTGLTPPKSGANL